MENMNFVPRDDFYVKKKNDSVRDDTELPCEEEQSFNVTQNQTEKQMNNDNQIGQISLETVLEKLQVDEDKVQSVNDSMFISVTEKIEAAIEFQDALSLPMSRDELITSSSKLGSTSNIYLAEDFETSRSHRRRTNLSNIFPAGIMGCKDEYANKNYTTIRLPCTQKNLETPSQTSHISEVIDLKKIKKMIDVKETEELEDPKEIKEPSQIQEIKEVIELKQETNVKEDAIQDTQRRMIKRKDGNPLLGVGYEDSPPIFTTTCKVPPGGFSHRLW